MKTNVKVDDRHVLKGGKVLDGKKLKRDDELIARRSGARIKFRGFTADGRVKVKPVNGKEYTMARSSLAKNYERPIPAYGRF